MTLQTTYELLTEIRSGRAMDVAIFLTLANLAKDTFENVRPWRHLVKKDTSKTQTTADGITTAKALPSDFRRTLPRRTLTLVSTDSNNATQPYSEILMEDQNAHLNDGANNFFIDYANGNYYLTNTVDRTYTHNFFYIKRTPAFTMTDLSETWVFPDEYHAYIAFEVAVMDELGMDYDDINARQGNANAARAAIILKSAIKNDEAMVRSALNV